MTILIRWRRFWRSYTSITRLDALREIIRSSK